MLTDTKQHLQKCTVGCAGPLEMLIDSGSDWNLISPAHWITIRNERRAGKANIYGVVENPDEVAMAYASTTPLKAIRSFYAWVEVYDAVKPKAFAKFYVVENGQRSVLSRQLATSLELLQIGLGVGAMLMNVEGMNQDEMPLEQAAEIQEFPAIPNFELEFDIDLDVPPTVRAYVNIPEAYLERAKERLETMRRQGIIERVVKAPRWCSGVGTAPKGKEDFRMYVAMMGPNKAIRRRFYKMPGLEGIRVKLAGAKFFTKLDLTMAFFHIRLAEKSRELTTFLSPNGMYRFCRLNFGVTSAPEAFQQKMEEILFGIRGVVVYIDDILIFAEDIPMLRLRTRQVLEALNINNLTLNVGKCEYEKEKLEFLGHEVSAEGFGISKKKVESVRAFRAPRTTSELKSFLGLASFLAQYIRNFAELTKSLWDLTAANAFKWSPELNQSFEEVKNQIIDCTIKQGFFASSDETFLYTDASPVALGAVLVSLKFQIKRVVAKVSVWSI